MNPKAQPDFHPDADLLSAFAEHALPEGERARILAHMAECGRCREVVFLAQAAAEPAMVPSPAPRAEARPGWFSAAFARWRVALIPASALAAVAIVFLWVRLHPAPASVQMAQVAEPPSAPTGTMAARMAPQPSAAEHSDRPVAPPPAPARAARIAPRGRPSSAAAAPGLVPNDKLTQMAEVPIPASAAPAGVAQKGDFNAVHLDGHSASLAIQAPSAGPSPSPREMAMAQARLEDHGQQKLEVAHGTAIGALQSRTAPVPAPAPPAAVSVNGAPIPSATPGAQFFDSTGARPIDTFPESNGFAMMRLARRARLPSGLHAVSSAAMLNRLVALDSAGAVFLSADGGKHWEAVTAPWSGKAIAVQAPPGQLYRVSTAPKPSEPVSLAEPAAADAERKQQEEPSAPVSLQSKAAPPAAPMLFKLVTDHHQTWVSSDGKVWREQ